MLAGRLAGMTRLYAFNCSRHPDTDILVEFPPGPLGVGEEPVKQVEWTGSRSNACSNLALRILDGRKEALRPSPKNVVGPGTRGIP